MIREGTLLIRKIFLEKSSYFFIALGLISPSSCSKFGRLSDSEKVTKVTIGSGSSYSKQHPRASQNGGVFVWGISSDEKFSFFLNNETESVSLTLKNGSWSFYATGWDGAKFEGNVRCGKQVASLNGTATDVQISLSATGCASADSFFGPTTFLNTAGEPQAVRLVTCRDFSGISNGACNSLSRGGLRSYRLKIATFPISPLSGGSRPNSYQGSACFDLPNANTGNSVTNTPFKIPVGSGSSSPIFTVLEGFESAGCGGAPIEFTFANGLLLDNGSTPNLTRTRDDLNNTVVFIAYGYPYPPPTLSGIQPASGPTAGGTNVTISGSGFVSPATVTIGGNSCSVTSSSATSIRCQTSSMAAGAQNVVVTNAGGSS